MSLSWAASAGATEYRIKRGTSSGTCTQVGTSSTVSYADTGLTNGVAYYYTVSALGSGGESADSSEAIATPSAALAALPEEDGTLNAIGLNTWFLNDYDGSNAFVDVAKQARSWQNATWTAAAPMDALGWPTTDASTVFWTGTGDETNGTYKLSFKGQADVALMWYGGSVANKVYDSATNTTTADVTVANSGSGSGGLKLTNTQRTATSGTGTGFTELHLYRPGYATDGSAVFTAPFLSALGKVSVVRMMDWTQTNGNLTEHWSQRRTPLHFYKAGEAYTGPGGATWAASSSSTGVALEHQIQLCNTLGRDMWVNIPVAADDDYVRKIALALRYGTDGTDPYTSTQTNPVYPPLDPSLHLYIEYGNEIWNYAGGFQCFGVIHDIVLSLSSTHPVRALAPSGSGEYQWLYIYPGYRMGVISDLFRGVYGDASMMSRVRPLLMTQQGNANNTLSLPLNWLAAYGQSLSPQRTVASYLYGAGGSGYYGVNTEPSDLTDLDAFFASGNYPATGNVKGFGVDSLWTSNSGLKHVAYEGGPSLDSCTAVQARAINADTRMQDMVEQTHAAWSAQGGDLLVYYCLVGAAQWEFTPDMATTDTPKFRALDALNGGTRAAVTLGQALPGTLVAADWRTAGYQIRTGYDYVSTVSGLDCVCGNDAGEWVAYPAHADVAFSGTLTLQAQSASGTTVAVWLNGVEQGEVSLAASTDLVSSSSLTLSFPSGLGVIRLQDTGGNGFNLRSLTVQ
nr:fibronectin type III domain-containing protein [uncultured Holophaga sp.]